MGIDGIMMLLHDEVIALGIGKDIHTAAEFLQHEIILDGISNIFENMNPCTKSVGIGFGGSILLMAFPFMLRWILLFFAFALHNEEAKDYRQDMEWEKYP